VPTANMVPRISMISLGVRDLARAIGVIEGLRDQLPEYVRREQNAMASGVPADKIERSIQRVEKVRLMEQVGDFEAKTDLPKLLDRVERGESLTITRHGKPVAQLVPVARHDRDRAMQAFERLDQIRQQVKGAPISELIDTAHEGHRY